MGYYRAGFDVVGVDINPQPRYPFEFHQSDAIEYCAEHWREFDAIHASPPCQAYSVTKSLTTKNHPMLVGKTRDLLLRTNKPYVIENVPGAPLVNPLILCGTMFGLGVIRHRMFESAPSIWMAPASCNHDGLATGGRERRRGNTKTPRLSDGYKFVTVVGNNYIGDEGRTAMQIDWMSKKELSQAIPPAYTEFIGRQLLNYLTGLQATDNETATDHV